MDMNAWQVTGRVTKPVEVTTVGNSKKAKTTIRLTGRKKRGEQYPESLFVDVEVWGEGAEFMLDHVTEGKVIWAQGSVEARAWTDREGKARVALTCANARIGFPSLPKTEDAADDGVGF